MKIMTIFDPGDFSAHGGLLSVDMLGDGLSEFEIFFDRMNDVEWLFGFFEAHEIELKNFKPSITRDDAITKTIEEIRHIEDALYDFFTEGINGSGIGLDQIFRPLNDHEYMIVDLQKTKARADKKRIKNPWCRLYAIRLDRNLFIVTGGGIKLTRTMNESSHLIEELDKLNRTYSYLKRNNILNGQDLNDYYENDEDNT
jgi:hypothetical protein